jgi:hypothetical protein
MLAHSRQKCQEERRKKSNEAKTRFNFSSGTKTSMVLELITNPKYSFTWD